MKKFALILSSRKIKSALSAIMSFMILIFTLNCGLCLDANASIEPPNDDPSKKILRKDLNLIDLIDCLYTDHRSSPFSGLKKSLLDIHTDNPDSRRVYEQTLNFFIQNKAKMPNPNNEKELDNLKQETWDEFERLRYDLFENTDEDAPPRPKTDSAEDTSTQPNDFFLPMPFSTTNEANDYTQPEIDSSGSEGVFDDDGYIRPLALMPEIPPPPPSLFRANHKYID